VTEVSGGRHSAQDTTVADLIDQWLNMARDELSPATVRGYQWIIATYITPNLGTVPLSRLRTAQLDRFRVGLREKGGQSGKPLAPATVRQVHAILRRAP
jgi:integrase